MWFFDRLALELLAPLAVWVLASGLDDLVIDLSWIWLRLKSKLWPNHVPRRPATTPTIEPRIAILVPCWQEDNVIEDMVRRNLGRIQYEHYDIWLALYPNDQPSIAAATRAQRLSKKVHWAAGKTPGPTTKADNINQLLDSIFRDE
jgi:adsorption protein B